MAAWVSSLIMLGASRPAPSPSSPARLSFVFDPGRSRRALRVRPQEEHGGPPRSPRAGRLASAGLDLAGTPPLDELPRTGTRKLAAVNRYVRDRPLAWVDDELYDDAQLWAQARRAPTLLIRTQPSVGLSRADVSA